MRNRFRTSRGGYRSQSWLRLSSSLSTSSYGPSIIHSFIRKLRDSNTSPNTLLDSWLPTDIPTATYRTTALGRWPLPSFPSYLPRAGYRRNATDWVIPSHSTTESTNATRYPFQNVFIRSNSLVRAVERCNLSRAPGRRDILSRPYGNPDCKSHCNVDATLRREKIPFVQHWSTPG